MPRLTQVFEKAVRTGNSFQQQELHITSEADENGTIGEYNQIQANLFINEKFIADISHLLDKANLFVEIVDSIDWAGLAKEAEIKNVDQQILN